MSGLGFHRFVAAAMVLQEVDALSDEDIQPRAPEQSAGSKTNEKTTKPGKSTKHGEKKTKAVAKKPKASPKKKKTGNEKPTDTEPDERSASPEQEVSVSEEVDEEVCKKPAAKPKSKPTKGMKRPAAATKESKPVEKKTSTVKKNYKYLYKDTQVWGFKIDGQQRMTVTRL